MIQLTDPPWNTAPSYDPYSPPAYAGNLGWWIAGTFALAGLLGWIISALNLKSYLKRRRPGEPGRVIDLFSERRKQRDTVQEDIRFAARAMMTRAHGALRPKSEEDDYRDREIWRTIHCG